MRLAEGPARTVDSLKRETQCELGGGPPEASSKPQSTCHRAGLSSKCGGKDGCLLANYFEGIDISGKYFLR